MTQVHRSSPFKIFVLGQHEGRKENEATMATQLRKKFTKAAKAYCLTPRCQNEEKEEAEVLQREDKEIEELKEELNKFICKFEKDIAKGIATNGYWAIPLDPGYSVLGHSMSNRLLETLWILPSSTEHSPPRRCKELGIHLHAEFGLCRELYFVPREFRFIPSSRLKGGGPDLRNSRHRIHPFHSQPPTE